MNLGVRIPDAPPHIADRRVFAANGIVFTVADLVRRTPVGNREAPVVASSPAQVEEGFRRARRLLRADQLDLWLDDWGIAADDFRRWTQDIALGTSSATPWCALLCSGSFDAVAAQVASAAAAACELGASPADADGFDPADWTEHLVALSTTTERLTAAIERHRLDWTRLAVTRVVTGSRGVAEELRHQVLSDGVDLRAAAECAGCPADDVTDVLAGFAPPALRAALAGAAAPELIGPVREADSWLVVTVRSRAGPTLADPDTRARATATVRADVIADAVARHVVA